MVLFRKVRKKTFSEYRKKPDIIGNGFMLSGPEGDKALTALYGTGSTPPG
ncbi:MAG: hypothetical protein WA081_10230 [Desulfosalsimonadaceae bacterium]